MGTTRDAMAAGGGRFSYVIAIEGFESLITNHHSMSAVTTAWSGTSWSSAIPGLELEGRIEQEIRPWSNEIPVSSFSFIVHNHDGNDDFGEAVWKAKPTNVTRLTAPFDATSGATTVNGQAFGALPASGTVYIGNSRVTYTSRTATALTIPAGALGTMAPFSINSPPANFFYPRPSGFGTTILDSSLVPKVSDSPRAWVGRWVGLWMHRNVGGVLDVKAEAELLFAGKITGLSENSDGATVVQAEDLRGVIRDTVVFENQFKGFAKEGVKLIAGDVFGAWEGDGTAGGTGDAADELVVVASGASGANEVDAGYYKLEDFLGKLNEWLAAEFTATNLPSRWSVSISPSDQGSKVWIRSESTTNAPRHFYTTNPHYLLFLGAEQRGEALIDVDFRAPYYRVGAWAAYGSNGALTSATNLIYAFQQPPYLTKVFQGRGLVLPHRTIELENPTGSWVLDGESLPHPFAYFRDTGEDRGFLLIDGKYPIFVKHDSDTEFSDMAYGMPPGFNDQEGINVDAGRRYGEDPRVEVKQLVYIGGTFKDLCTKLLASIQGNGVNHADYDAYPWGCGIPWELLGDDWLESISSLEQASQDTSFVTFLDRPTKVLDILLEQLVLRFAFPIFKHGTLRLVSPKAPNATAADYTLDETNKAAATGDQANLSAVTRVTNELMRNVVKIEFDRSLSKNEYGKVLEFRDAGSIAEHGMTAPLTIRVRSAYADYQGSGAAAAQLAASLIAQCAPIFGRPLRMYRRSVDGALFDIAPGDTASLTDDFARDPTTGVRGLSNRGVTVLKTSFDLASCVGEVDVMFSEEDRTFPMGPAADFDDAKDDSGYSNGWHAAGKLVWTVQHAYSRSADAIDASHFTIGDEVLVVETDPSDPSSADSFSDTIAGVSSNILSLSNGFGVGGRPAFSTSKRYRIVFNIYTTTNTNQRDTAFQADSVDGQILGTIEPNLAAPNNTVNGFTENDLTEKWQNHNEDVLAEGHSFSTANARDLIRNLNSIVNYTSAYNCPFIGASTSFARTATPAEWQLLAQIRIPVVLSPWPAGFQRKLTLAVRFLSISGASVSIRLTVRPTPPHGTSNTNIAHDYPYRQVTFTTTSTTSVEATSQMVPPISANGGSYYVLVEGQTANIGAAGSFFGITRFQLGPLEAIA